MCDAVVVMVAVGTFRTAVASFSCFPFARSDRLCISCPRRSQFLGHCRGVLWVRRGWSLYGSLAPLCVQ